MSQANRDRLLVEVRQLSQFHPKRGGQAIGLLDFDLDLAQGERLAVVGPSGTGKTTLLTVLAGLERPGAGWAWVGGHDLSRLAGTELAAYRRHVVGYVWQRVEIGLWPQLSAVENVELPMIGEVSRSTRRERASELLESLALGARLHDRLVELSYADRQRLALAVALANGPRLLLADEPTAGLDGSTAQQLLVTLQGLLRERGTSAILTTNDARAQRYVDRVVELNASRRVAPPLAAV